MGGEGGARARVTPRASATGARGSRRQARTRRVAREEGRATHLARRERPRARRGNEGGRGLFPPRNDGDPSRAIVRIFARILQRAFSLSKTHARTWVRTAPVVQQTVALARLARKISHRSSTVHPRVRRPAREISKAFRPDAASLRLSRPPSRPDGRGRGGAPGTRPRSETLADLTGTSTRLAAATLNPPRPPPERGERACTASRRVHHPLRAGVEITDTMIPPRDSRDALAPLIITPFAPRRGPSARRRRRSVVLRPPRSRRARPRRRRRE